LFTSTIRLTSIKATLLFITFLGFTGCASIQPPPLAPCITDNKNTLNCPLADEEISEHQKSREWLPANEHSQDFLLLAMNKEIPVQDAHVKFLGSDHQTAVSSIATKIWLINNAKYSVDLTYYIFTKDLSGYAILGSLCNAVKRGVDVRIMVDSMGSYSMNHSGLKALINCNGEAGLRRNPQGQETVTRAKVQAVIFNSLTRLTARANRRSHDKLLIIDGAYSDDAWVLTGGRNVSNDYYGFDDNLKDDLSVFKDMEILLKPKKNSQGSESVSQIAEYYYSHTRAIKN
jgi:putative cardiolipin synthase